MRRLILMIDVYGSESLEELSTYYVCSQMTLATVLVVSEFSSPSGCPEIQHIIVVMLKLFNKVAIVLKEIYVSKTCGAAELEVVPFLP